MAKFNLTATVNTSLAGTTLTGAEGLGTTLSGQQGFTVGVLNGVGPTGPTGPTGDQGPQGIQGIQGPQGIQGIQGPTGAGFTGGSYDSSNGTVTFTSDDGLGFSTGDLRGADGTGSGTVTSVGTGGGLTGGPVTSSGTISHADTSTQANITATANTYVDGLTFDTYGHVTGVSTVAGFDGNYSSLAGVPTTFTPSSHTLSSHSDVSTTSPTDGQVLAWNNTGSTWEPQTVSGGGSSPTVARQTKVNTSTFGTAADTLTWTHGQGAAPVLFWLELECIQASGGYQVGDIRQLFSGDAYSQDIVTIYSRGTTTLHAAWNDDAAIEFVSRWSDGALSNDDANWKIGLAGLWL